MTDFMGFYQIIKDLPTDLSVLDVGAYGLNGENTSTYLSQHFEKVLTVNNKKLEGVKVVADFYNWEPPHKFDLVVLDLNMDNNIARDWTQTGLNRVHGMLKEGGLLVNYVLLYGDYHPDLVEKIKTHRKEFWKCSDSVSIGAIGHKLYEFKDLYELRGIHPDIRRQEIAWVVLRKK